MAYNVLYLAYTPAPYKRPRLNAISKHDDIELTVYYSAQSNRRHKYTGLPPAEFEANFVSSTNASILGFEPTFSLSLFRKILSFDADVYLAGGWNHFPTWILLAASKIKDVPIGVISANTEQGRFSKPILSKVLRWFDFYLALSKSAKENFVKLGVNDEKVTILPNVIDVKYFQSSIDESVQNSLREKWRLHDSKVILYVGNLGFEKGVHNLIDAVSRVKEECHLLVVGDGPYRNELESLAKRTEGVSATFVGKIPNSDLPNYYALSEVFVLPTHSDTWGLVVNEALACGTPVISTTSAGVSGELLQHKKNGLVVPPKSPKELAESVEHLLSNDELRKHYGDIGIELSERYTPLRYAEKMVKAIDSVTTKFD